MRRSCVLGRRTLLRGKQWWWTRVRSGRPLGGNGVSSFASASASSSSSSSSPQYPAWPCDTSHTHIRTFRDQWGHLGAGERAPQATNVCGRIVAKRTAGKSLVFYTLQQSRERLQVMAVRPDDVPASAFAAAHAGYNRGDVVWVSGVPGATQKGELSIVPQGLGDMVVMASCLHDVPEQLTQMSRRLSRRHVDLLVNQDMADRLRLRSVAVNALRSFLLQHHYVEVETPILGQHAGGAIAKAFTTTWGDDNNDIHADETPEQRQQRQLQRQLHLRIAPELRLKQLLIGGMDRVFEIGRVFRNEGVDATHSPEFTTCEFYCANASVEHLYGFTQRLIGHVAQECAASSLVPGLNGGIDWAADGGDWKRLDVTTELERCLGSALPDLDDEHVAVKVLRDMCDAYTLEVEAPVTVPRLLDRLIGAMLEPQCEEPTFICNHPLVMSPLAKQHPTRPHLCERFELFVKGKELVNAYTELNDPVEQRTRFQQQAQLRARYGDAEAHGVDEDFCEALEWGLPPTAGWGMGIDRLMMFLSDRSHIRDVVAFPMGTT